MSKIQKKYADLMISNSMDNWPFSFVVAVNNEEVFCNNVLSSPIFHGKHPHEILVRKGFSSACLAYNDGIENTKNDIMVFIHQDVYLPNDWDVRLRTTIEFIEATERKLGVLGCFGISIDGLPVGHVYSNGLKRELGAVQSPSPVQSLDELLLVFRKASGLKFDPKLPNFHFYGTDICLQSKMKGLKNYAISNFCVHNSLTIRRLPKEFWRCAEYLRSKWKNELPVTTSCVTLFPLRSKRWLTRANSELRFFYNRLRYQKTERLINPSIVVSDKNSLANDS